MMISVMPLALMASMTSFSVLVSSALVASSGSAPAVLAPAPGNFKALPLALEKFLPLSLMTWAYPLRGP